MCFSKDNKLSFFFLILFLIPDPTPVVLVTGSSSYLEDIPEGPRTSAYLHAFFGSSRHMADAVRKTRAKTPEAFFPMNLSGLLTSLSTDPTSAMLTHIRFIHKGSLESARCCIHSLCPLLGLFNLNLSKFLP